jgi:hypothetical protein
MMKHVLWIAAPAACALIVSACCGSSETVSPTPSTHPEKVVAQPAPPPENPQAPVALPEKIPAPPPSGSGQETGPEKVADQYLRAGSATGDASAIPALVDPACQGNEKIMRVDAVRMMGIPMTLENVTVTPAERDEQSARVEYHVSGRLEGEQGASKIGNFSIKVNNVKMANVSLKGSLRLKNISGRWLVSCE